MNCCTPSQIAFSVEGNALRVYEQGFHKGTIPMLPPETVNSYLRPDGTSYYLRPDGLSLYTRPA